MPRLRSTAKVPELQANATLSQANPVSGTKYTVLTTSKNVRWLGYESHITWTVQPNPLEIHQTVDDIAKTGSVNNPVSGTSYYVTIRSYTDAPVLSTTDMLPSAPFIFECRSLKIEAEITGGTVQSLTANVRYQKW